MKPSLVIELKKHMEGPSESEGPSEEGQDSKEQLVADLWSAEEKKDKAAWLDAFQALMYSCKDGEEEQE